MSDRGGDRLREDSRWKFGVPHRSRACGTNYAWVQHFIHHLAPAGMAAFVLANGPAVAGSSNQSGEGEIRKAIVEADLVDCMVALPGQLFYSTHIPVCLWFLTRSKAARTIRHGGETDPPECIRERRGETLFIDARKLGRMIDRVHRELTEEDIERIANTYHEWRYDDRAWRGEAEKVGCTLPAEPGSTYHDIPGFCKSAKLEESHAHGRVVTPGRYVGAADIEDDGEPFGQKMKRLSAKLEEQFEESAKLEMAIRQNLKGLGYGC
jgi:type I restriction enzyme M protein